MLQSILRRASTNNQLEIVDYLYGGQLPTNFAPTVVQLWSNCGPTVVQLWSNSGPWQCLMSMNSYFSDQILLFSPSLTPPETPSIIRQ